MFPELFKERLKPGQIYTWGQDTNLQSVAGLIIRHPEFPGCFSFIDFYNGYVYVSCLAKDSTKYDLFLALTNINKKDPKALYDRYIGELKGPKHLSSWCYK